MKSTKQIQNWGIHKKLLFSVSGGWENKRLSEWSNYPKILLKETLA